MIRLEIYIVLISTIFLFSCGDKLKQKMKQLDFSNKEVSEKYDYLAPDGSEIRLLQTMANGGLVHCTLNSGKISSPITHKTVEEIWYILEGTGEVWRKKGGKEEIISVGPGVSLTIPIGTHFQFRNIGNDPLKFIIVTMPPWPGSDEAVSVMGKW